MTANTGVLRRRAKGCEVPLRGSPVVASLRASFRSVLVERVVLGGSGAVKPGVWTRAKALR